METRGAWKINLSPAVPSSFQHLITEQVLDYNDSYSLCSHDHINVGLRLIIFI